MEDGIKSICLLEYPPRQGHPAAPFRTIPAPLLKRQPPRRAFLSIFLSKQPKTVFIFAKTSKCHPSIYNYGRYDQLVLSYELVSPLQYPDLELYRLLLEATFVARHRPSQFQDIPIAHDCLSRTPTSGKVILLKGKRAHRKARSRRIRPLTWCLMHYEIKTPKQTISSPQSTYLKIQVASSTKGIRLQVYFRTPL